MLKQIIFVSILSLSIFYSCDTREKLSSNVVDRGEIVVAMDLDMPGYFTLNDENYGYQYDLLKAYADKLGVQLKIVSGNNPGQNEDMFIRGEIDMIATLASHIDGDKKDISVPVYSTSYVILSRKGAPAKRFLAKDFSLFDAMENQKLLVSYGFKASKNFNILLDSLDKTDIFLSARTSFELIEDLSGGEYDYVICEKSEAQLGCAFVKNVTQVYDFTESIPVSVVVNPLADGLCEDFNNWLEEYSNGSEYAMLNYLYFEKGIVGQLMGDNLKRRTNGGISPYDEIIRNVSQQEGYDWRLMLAIAYSESRFNANIISPRGAKGLMQIMPIVARQFEVNEQDLMKPEINVMLAAKLLKKIEHTLKISPSTPYNDRVSIVLACYNGGIGHVLDARALAAKYGESPDAWDSVSKYLTLKGNPEFIDNEDVKCGRFRGSGETLAFVSQVIGKYNSYCNHVVK